MSTPSTMTLKDAWRRFALELELARNYHKPYLLYMMRTHRNPLLDYILPSLLHIKAVALLDEGLVEVIDNRGLVMPKTYRKVLEGRLSFLADQGILTNSPVLHQIRGRRNDLAHESSSQLTWQQLDSDVAEIQSTLQHLGLIGPQPKREYFGERSALEESSEPDILGVQHFKFGVKEDGQVALEVTWSEKLHRVGK